VASQPRAAGVPRLARPARQNRYATLVLANAQHGRAIPGRKSDANDAVWLADLLAHRVPCGVPYRTVRGRRRPAVDGVLISGSRL